METETQRTGMASTHSHHHNETGRRATFSGTHHDPSSDSNGRQWSRVGDPFTGRYDYSQRLWYASGTGRQYPMIPVVNRFIESHRNPGANGLDPNHMSTEDSMYQPNIHLSSHLPRRVWVVLAKCLGVKLSHSDKPILATVLHVFTLMAALTFAIPGAWYTVYDIHSKFSKTTVLIGSVQIIIGFAWTCLGVYAHNLAGRLFNNRNFVECVRVHSKTFMKVSTSWLTIMLGAVVIGVNCYEASPIFYNNSCSTAETEIVVCQVYFIGRVVYAVVSLIWNFIVAYVLFSVCRTHTIGIRRFMRELNFDAKWYEDFCLRQYNIQRGADDRSLEDSWFLWDDLVNNEGEDDSTSKGIFLQSVSSYQSFSSHRRFSSYHLRRRSTATTRASQDGDDVTFSGGGGGDDNGCSGVGGDQETEDDRANEVFATPATVTNASVNGEPAETDGGDHKEPLQSQISFERKNEPTMLTNEDLLFSYWKFLRRLCVTSRFLQRWLASWIAFIIMWDGYFIIYWTSHSASLVGILQFVVPLLVLLLICSAYAEVNAEGQRLLKTICPLEERMAMLFYFNQQPLSVRVFSFTVTYNAMLTVILGFSVAFASRMIMDEISRV